MEKKQICTALERARYGYEKYVKIMDMFSNVNVSLDKEFQNLYTDFYKIRHKNINFYDAYYTYLEQSKRSKPTFTDALKCLYKFGRLEASFASKLLATIDPNLPVWDQFILKYFHLVAPSREIIEEARIRQANVIYEDIIKKYKAFLAGDESKMWIQLFDEYYPNNKLTSIKKLDLISVCL